MGDKINIRTVYDGKQEAESISDEIESYQRNKIPIGLRSSREGKFVLVPDDEY